MDANSRHAPVLLQETLQALSLRSGDTVVDVTVGLGGHSAAFLTIIGEKGHLIALDADAENLADAKKHLENLPGEKTFYHSNFAMLSELSLPPCDVLFADLGLSSPHLDDPERGFSFRFDAPLDLRFDRESGETVAEFIARSSPEELQKVLSEFGEIRPARKLAAEIAESKPETTTALSECVERIYGFRAKGVRPQVFQAFRIAINDELGALASLLQYGPYLLKEEGKMAVISFHSLEDRMVKRAFRALSTPEIDDRTGAISQPASFILPSRKAIKPSEEEISHNPRARSARLRILQKAM